MKHAQKKNSKSFVIDMDGVLVRGNRLIAGADVFLKRLAAAGRKYLVLTNNSERTPRDLEHRLRGVGLMITADHIYTSALATARFLRDQKPGGTAFVIGETGLKDALHRIGYILTDRRADYVVIGDTQNYDHRQITQAIRLIHEGARFIATNPDATGPSESGIVPATGSLTALVEKATGRRAYFIGKPNPLMIRTALRQLREHSENAIMVGDRMDTDIVAGIEVGMETVLVLTGVTRRSDIDAFPYRPARVVESVNRIQL